ncbi:D-alanyl-D-alanine carboxypeptidase [Microbacterium lemovicicum]|uniref:D-alanyl-D-alanine carboxypeptidase n=1 Tax=Microbacterium lemovicicum TaxID=1072463 RepID=A0A3Q9J0P0_9MICO|nr:serine hydrolase domain-containing protein [Microbacterium lemovicicum]AZS38568.1 D-alanyl-D-alanine carboxypeptidase [Microbacterium lemovicicum]
MARRGRRRPAAALAAVLAIGLAITGCSAETTVTVDVPAQVQGDLPEATVQQLQDAVTSAMTASGSSGAIVGVWAPWSGQWISGLGTQTPGGADPVNAEATFRAGRVTRAMTCDALYAVAAEGKLALTDEVSDWVSGVPDLTDVTLGSLCDSTSGVGSYAPQLSSLWLGNPTRVWNPHELASYGLGQSSQGTPGSGYFESDAGYVLLGLALERATGESAATVLQQYVFDPLALDSTRLPSGEAAPPSTSGPVLSGYQSFRDGNGVMNCAAPTDYTVMSASSGYTNSGVVSDITDLGRYAQALASGSLLTNGQDRFANPLPAYSGAPSWFTARGGAYQAGSMVGQYGAFPGYLTAAFSDPTSGLTVAVVLNNSAVDTGVVAGLAWELAAIASKAPAASGSTTPDAGLPWTAQQFHDAIIAASICPPAQ